MRKIRRQKQNQTLKVIPTQCRTLFPKAGTLFYRLPSQPCCGVEMSNPIGKSRQEHPGSWLRPHEGRRGKGETRQKETKVIYYSQKTHLFQRVKLNFCTALGHSQKPQAHTHQLINSQCSPESIEQLLSHQHQACLWVRPVRNSQEPGPRAGSPMWKQAHTPFLCN